MTGTAEDRQEPAEVRSDVHDSAGVTAQNAFSDLKEAVKAAGSLKAGGAADHGQNRKNHVDRRLAHRNMEAENQHHQADTADEAEGHTSLSGAVEQADQNYDQL